VVQGDQRADALLDQIVDDLVVKRDALGVHLAVAVRNDARPREGEAIGLQTKLLHQVDVLFPVVVEVAGHLGVGLLVRKLEGVEVGHGHAFAALIPAAFDLEGRGGGTPEEACRKLIHHVELLS